jgi:hypothetical protein
MNTRKTQHKSNANPAPVQHADGQPRFVGVDLHKKVATFHVLFQDGTSLKSGSFDVGPDSIRGFAAKHLRPTDQLAVEVTSNTWAFVGLVRPYVANVVVSNPLKTAAWLQRARGNPRKSARREEIGIPIIGRGGGQSQSLTGRLFRVLLGNRGMLW